MEIAATDNTVMGEPRGYIDDAGSALRELLATTGRWDSVCEEAATAFVQGMCDAGLPKKAVLQALRETGISRRGARQLFSKVAKQKKAELPAEEPAGTPVCPHCLEPVTELDHFCPKCCGPITAYASIDPMGQIYSTGRAYQQAVSGKPRLVVLAAMWLIFGPQIPAVLLGISLSFMSLLKPDEAYRFGDFSIEPESSGFVGALMQMLVLIGFLIIYTVILWKVTARWLNRSRKPGVNGGDGERARFGD